MSRIRGTFDFGALLFFFNLMPRMRFADLRVRRVSLLTMALLVVEPDSFVVTVLVILAVGGATIGTTVSGRFRLHDC